MGVKHIHVLVTEEKFNRLEDAKGDDTWEEVITAGAGLEEEA